MHIRTYKERDLNAILDLANRRNKKTHEFVPLTKTSFKKWVEESKALVLIAEDKPLAGFAVAEKGWPAESDEIQISMLCVEAVGKAASVERALLDSCQKHSKANGILTTLPIGDRKIKQQEKWGFQLDGGILQLTRSLRKMPLQPPIMKGAKIRGLRKGEEEEFVSLLNTSYARPRLTMKDFEGWQRDDPLFNYEWVQVVEFEGRLIGAGVARRDLEYNEYYQAERGYLGPSGTLPEFRGRGLNRTVNWHAMNEAKNFGMTSASLYTHEENFPVLKLTHELGYTIIYHWKLLKRGEKLSRLAMS
jgi:ribosomal protein S18 acetylase RimI-like enzyme